MLDDLCGKARKGLTALYELLVQVFHGYVHIPCDIPLTLQRQAAFLCLIGQLLLCYLRVYHYPVLIAVGKDDYPLADAYHICRHPHTAAAVGSEGIFEVVYHFPVLVGGFLGNEPEKSLILAYRLYHIYSSKVFVPGSFSAVSDIAFPFAGIVFPALLSVFCYEKKPRTHRGFDIRTGSRWGKAWMQVC